MKNPLPTAAWLILLLALLLRVGYMVATPGYELVHDAPTTTAPRVSIAARRRLRRLGAPGARDRVPPARLPVLLGRRLQAHRRRARHEHERVVPARILGIIIGTLIVAMIGMVARAAVGPARRARWRWLGAAIYIPLILVGGSVMSEPLFALLLLGALAAAIQHRRSTHRWRWAVLAGVLAGPDVPDARERARAAAAARARGVGRAAALVVARARPRRRVLVALALLTVSPWTIRNAIVFHRVHPGLDPARLRARRHLQRPGAARQAEPGLVAQPLHIPEYQHSTRTSRTIAEPELEDSLRARVEGLHPRAPDATSRRSLSGPRCGCSTSAALALVAPHRVDDQRHPGLGGRGRDLLLGVRAAGARGRVHAARAADAAVRVGGPGRCST